MELPMTSWYGHLPVTSIALFSILSRLATDDCDFSRDERVLFTACEYWAAVSATDLRSHLGRRPAGRLRAAGFEELNHMDSQELYDEYIARLEQQLQVTDDSVDVLIGLMAQHCISAAKLTEHTSGLYCN
jgi:hypothetical protein